MEFTATLQLDGKTATGITVPPQIIEALDAGKKPAVAVTINGYRFATTLGVRDGASKIPVSAEHRKGAGIAAGDELAVRIELDTAPRTVEVPADVTKALGRDPQAKAFFATLTASQQKGFVTPIEDAKTPETRQKRIDKAVTALREGRKRP